MRYYPLFLDLHAARCLVVGAGRVGRRKIGALLDCAPASLLVLDPGLDEAAAAALKAEFVPNAGPLTVERRDFQPEDLEGRTLVFAATPSAAVNGRIARLADAAGILCNVAGPVDAGEGNVLVPAHVEDGPLVLALSTGGRSPALARALREELEAWLGKGYAPLLALLEALRPRVLALGLGSDADAVLFRALCRRPLRDQLMAALERRDAAALDALLRPLLPAALPFSAEEFLHELD